MMFLYRVRHGGGRTHRDTEEGEAEEQVAKVYAFLARESSDFCRARPSVTWRLPLENNVSFTLNRKFICYDMSHFIEVKVRIISDE